MVMNLKSLKVLMYHKINKNYESKKFEGFTI